MAGPILTVDAGPEPADTAVGARAAPSELIWVFLVLTDFLQVDVLAIPLAACPAYVDLNPVRAGFATSP